MEKYSSGDVCERCRWQSKRAIRSGSGQNLAKRAASNKFWAPQQGRRADRRRWRIKRGERMWLVLGYAEHCKFALGKHCARSKFGEANSEQQILGTATGSKRRDSKTNRPRHSLFPEPLRCLAFTDFDPRQRKQPVYSFLSKFRQLNIWRSTQVVEEA